MTRNPFDCSNFRCADDAVRLLTPFFEGNFELPHFAYCEVEGIKKNAYGEALLFSKLLLSRTEPLSKEWQSFTPFGPGTPPLELLTECDGSVVRFPTFSSEKVKVWRLYLIRKNDAFSQYTDHRRFLADNIIADRDSWIFISSDFTPPADNIDGTSWQLAYKLAQRALEHFPVSNGSLYSKLVTGSVENGLVANVSIERKIELFQNFAGLSIIPDSNISDIPEDLRSKIIGVKTVEQAWHYITGTGVERTSVILPEKIECLDILVGKAWKPVFSVILLLNPAYVRLWCSDETRHDAEVIRDTLSALDQLSVRFRILTMDSHNLQQSYSDFRRVRDEEPIRGGQLICNTGGNRLMGTAALLVARENNIQVVYRDIDAAPHCLTVIQFGKENNYESDDVKVNNSPLSSSINWKELYSRNNFPTTSKPENLIEMILNK